MATIKRNSDGKILFKDGKASCVCCSGCCELLSYFDFFDMNEPQGCRFVFIASDSGDEEPNPPQSGWLRDRHVDGSCLRGVCMGVSDGVVKQAQVYGGPTTNDRDLTQLVTQKLGGYLEKGCYAARIAFWGWVRPRDGVPNKWSWASPSDSKWEINLYKLVCGGVT